MSALGQKQTCAAQKVMSALPPKADICGATRDVRFVPEADSCTAAKLQSASAPAGHVVVLNLSSQLRAHAHRSISPNTMSSEPRIAETSASMWPRVRKSIAERRANDGARILHL